MNGKTPTFFDSRNNRPAAGDFEHAWASLRPQQRATMLKTTLAERILRRPLRANGTATDCLTLRSWSSRPKMLEFGDRR